MPVNHAQLHLLLARAQYDLAAVQSAPLIVLGDQLGLYRLLAEAPLTAPELAERSETDVRFIDSWLLNQTAGGYVTFDPTTGRYALTDEQKCLFADESNPFFLPPSFALAVSLGEMTEALTHGVRGEGISAERYPEAAFTAIGRLARARSASLVSSLSEEVKTSLAPNGNVLEVGCGEGHALIALAAMFPSLRGIGIDSHAPSIERARRAAAMAGVDKRIEFAVREAHDLPRGPFAVVLCIESLHEIANPAGAVSAIHGMLRPGGRLIVTEALAGNTFEENLNASGRLLAATNFLFCLPTSIASGGGAIGAIAGERRLLDLIAAAGFSSTERRESATHLILVGSA